MTKLALLVLLVACKRDDGEPPAPPEPIADKAKQTLEAAEAAAQKARETAELAKDKAAETAEVVRDKTEAFAREAKDRASEAIDNATTLRKALDVVRSKIDTAVQELSKADSDDARRAAQAAVDKLRREKDAIEKQLEAIKNK
jgi:hypothetical protein